MKQYEQKGQYYQIIPVEKIVEKFGRTDMMPIKFQKSIDKKLKTNLIVPPKYSAYSLAIQYMSDWFYKKFPNGFFHHKYLNASHVMDQLRTYRTRDLLVVNKPASEIVVDEDTEFNRNNIDLHNFGLTLYSNRSRIEDSFFMDREKNLYITFVPRQIKLNFSFTIRVSTKAIQDDLAELSEMAFRAQASQKHFIDADFPVPKELIGQLACDLGMCNEEGKYDVYKMLHYLNQRSKLAFLYKFNPAINGMDYFIRVPHFLVHIITSPIQKNQAVMKNMSATDFSIRFNCEVRFPAIKFFAYYSLTKMESIQSYTRLDANSFLFGITNLCNVPATNERGWQWDFRSEYMLESKEELEKFNNKELITISIADISGELRESIEYTKNIALNPHLFIDIKAFNYLKYIPIYVNWEKMTLTFLEPLTTQKIYLFFYIDKSYLHNSMRILKRYDEYRIRDSNDIIGPQKELGTKLPDIGEGSSH